MNKDPDVETWFEEFDHPLLEAIEELRRIILSDSRMNETIKSKSPTFMYEGNMASINPRTKAHASLMFHTGAAIEGNHRLLEGGGETARYMKFADRAAVSAAEPDLMAVIDAWCRGRDAKLNGLEESDGP